MWISSLYSIGAPYRMSSINGSPGGVGGRCFLAGLELAV